MKTTVAQALIDPRVRDGRSYFRARHPDTNDLQQTELFRLRPGALRKKHTIFGADIGYILQRQHGGGWKEIGRGVPIDWLPEEAELVERTKEMP